MSSEVLDASINVAAVHERGKVSDVLAHHVIRLGNDRRLPDWDVIHVGELRPRSRAGIFPERD